MPDIVLYITRIPVKEINLKNKAKQNKNPTLNGLTL